MSSVKIARKIAEHIKALGGPDLSLLSDEEIVKNMKNFVILCLR